MNKSFLCLLLLTTGAIFSGDDQPTLMQLVGTYRVLRAKVQKAESDIRTAEASPEDGRNSALNNAYIIYEQVSKQCESFLLNHPELAAYLAEKHGRSTIIARPQTPDEITFSSPSYRASSPCEPMG